MNVKRHPLQIQRLEANDEAVPDRWSLKEVMEHAISYHPDSLILYEMLFDWYNSKFDDGKVNIDFVEVVMPMSDARRAAALKEGNEEDDDSSKSNSTTAVLVPLNDMWGVLVEYDWGNPDVYTKLAEYCPSMAPFRSFKAIQGRLKYTIPVYFPAAAKTLLPPTAMQISDASYRVDLDHVTALVIALRIAPRDNCLYESLIKVMRVEEQRRTYIAYRAIVGKDENNFGISEVVDRYFRPNSGGIICHIPIRLGTTSSFSSNRMEYVYLTALDIECLSIEAAGIVPESKAARLVKYDLEDSMGSLQIVRNHIISACLEEEKEEVERKSNNSISMTPSSTKAEEETPQYEEEDVVVPFDSGPSALDLLCNILFGTSEDLLPSHSSLAALLDDHGELFEELSDATTTQELLDDFASMVVDVAACTKECPANISNKKRSENGSSSSSADDLEKVKRSSVAPVSPTPLFKTAEIIRRLTQMKLIDLMGVSSTNHGGSIDDVAYYLPICLFTKTWLGFQALGSVMTSHNRIALDFRPEQLQMAIRLQSGS